MLLHQTDPAFEGKHHRNEIGEQLSVSQIAKESELPKIGTVYFFLQPEDQQVQLAQPALNCRLQWGTVPRRSAAAKRQAHIKQKMEGDRQLSPFPLFIFPQEHIGLGSTSEDYMSSSVLPCTPDPQSLEANEPEDSSYSLQLLNYASQMNRGRKRGRGAAAESQAKLREEAIEVLWP